MPMIPAAWARYTLFQYTDGPYGPPDQTLWPRSTPGFGKIDRSAYLGTAEQLRGRSSRMVASPGVGIGQRPLASTLPDGSTFVATDAIYAGMVGAHPKIPGSKIWYATGTSNRNDNLAIAAAAGVTTNHLGVYNAATRVFTQATAIGQFCNARASSTAGGGAAVIIGLQLGTLFALVGASGLNIGDELMCDAAGLWFPYVNNGANVPLGIASTFSAAGGTQTTLQYDW